MPRRQIIDSRVLKLVLMLMKRAFSKVKSPTKDPRFLLVCLDSFLSNGMVLSSPVSKALNKFLVHQSLK